MTCACERRKSERNGWGKPACIARNDTKRSRLAAEVFAEVSPSGVEAFYERNLLFAAPSLYLLLAGNGIADVSERFKVDELRDVVCGSEAWDLFLFVLGGSGFEEIGASSIRLCRARLAAGRSGLEKDGGGDVEAFAQSLNVGFVQGALFVQYFGYDALGAKDGHQVFLAKIVGIHQRLKNFDGRSIGNGMMLFFPGLD
jgi:hypothetical protein